MFSSYLIHPICGDVVICDKCLNQIDSKEEEEELLVQSQRETKININQIQPEKHQNPTQEKK